MIARLTGLIGICALLSGCDERPFAATLEATYAPTLTGQTQQSFASAADARKAYVRIAGEIKPIADKLCRRRTKDINCDFRFIVEPGKKGRSNAYQYLDEAGRPVVAFTPALIEDARNEDEIAFVMGHEAAHHIEGHILRRIRDAQATAIIFNSTAKSNGKSAREVRADTITGEEVGARIYSKDRELEADALGTQITMRAGYSAIKGSAFFARIPDPGDRFLGTHPPNAARVKIVRDTVRKFK